MDISDDEFDKLISQAMDKLSPKYLERLKNVAIIYADEPSPQQRQRLKLQPHQSLYGLYEGVPLPKRGGQVPILPDKITIFKAPLLGASQNIEQLQENIKHTLWHEVAHYFGLDHGRIHELEK